jgi:hypothetical protein
MMGQHDRSEALFYYFRLEDQVPETHLLRLIDKHISFEFVREKLKASYSEMRRPSIDRELLLRILLIGYLYGITSERKLVEELRMHLAWRWFTGLGFERYRITPRSPKTGTDGFRNRSCSRNCLSRSCASVWTWGWCRGSICRWMAASWKQTLPGRVGFHGNSWGKRHRSITRCVSICRNWNSRTWGENQFMSKNRYPPPTRTQLTPPRAPRQPGWGTTTTIWWTTKAA